MGVSNLESKVYETTHVQPSTRTKHERTIPLSIVDSIVFHYAATAAIWVFDSPISENEESKLQESLSHALLLYPQFAGELFLTPYPKEPPSKHTERFRRVVAKYGWNTDPGVLFELASIQCSASSLFPSHEERLESQRYWDLSDISIQELFLPKALIPGPLLACPAGASPVQIRVTRFECGGVCIGAKMAHSLADAATLIAFAHAWGIVHKNLSAFTGQPEPGVERLFHDLSRGKEHAPVFDPSRLDSCAAGSIDAPKPEKSYLEKAAALPLPRFDWWEHESGKPAFMDNNPQTVIPQEVQPADSSSRRRGRRIPWEDWNIAAPVSHRVLKFDGDELEWMHHAVRKHLQPNDSLESSGANVSHHDAVVTFLWQLITVARVRCGSYSDEAESAALHTEPSVWLDITLGLRSRLRLPPYFAGSPVFLAGFELPISQVIGRCVELPTRREASAEAGDGDGARDTGWSPDMCALGAAAVQLRQHVSHFGSEALATWLHEQAFEIAPQRIWNGFLGHKHVMATSWIGSGIWDIDFGFGAPEQSEMCGDAVGNSAPSRLRWAGNAMTVLDGLVTVTESKATATEGSKIPWWKRGVDVDANLNSNVMAEVLRMLTDWRTGDRDLLLADAKTS